MLRGAHSAAVARNAFQSINEFKTEIDQNVRINASNADILSIHIIETYCWAFERLHI